MYASGDRLILQIATAAASAKQRFSTIQACIVLSIRAFTPQLISRRRLFVKIAVRDCLNATRIMLRWPFAIFRVIYSRTASGFHFVTPDKKKRSRHWSNLLRKIHGWRSSLRINPIKSFMPVRRRKFLFLSLFLSRNLFSQMSLFSFLYNFIFFI